MIRSKYIFMDLDGTLLNDEKVVIQENKDAIIEALDLGHSVYFATGRPYRFAQSIAKTIDARIKLISFNGAVFDWGDLQVSHPLHPKDVAEIVAVVQDLNVPAFFKTQECVYTNRSKDERFSYDAIGMETIEGFTGIEQSDIIKVLLIEENAQDITAIRDMFSSRFELSYYEGKGLEFVDKNINKGSAIKYLVDRLSISLKDIIVFGDDVNDLSMFEQAYDKIAPSNAAAIIKGEATFISLDCNEGSIAHGLRHLKITTSKG